MSGFPYEVIWEHLNPDWETFAFDPQEWAMIEARFGVARALGAPEHLCVEARQIDDLLQPLEIADGARGLLARLLYWLAGVYLTREHRKFLRSDPAGLRDHLKSLTMAAKSLHEALSKLPPEGAALLSLVRPAFADALNTDRGFDFGMFGAEVHDLALVAQQIVEDIPRLGRGRSVDQMREQWVWQATTAVEHHTGVRIRAFQSNTDGRKPRLEGTEGIVLRSYLRLVSRALNEATIVRIITKRRRERKGKPAS